MYYVNARAHTHMHTGTYFNYQCKVGVKDLELTENACVMLSHEGFSFSLKSSFISNLV